MIDSTVMLKTAVCGVPSSDKNFYNFETRDQNSHSLGHCVTYGWDYSENNPWKPLEDYWGALDPTLKTTILDCIHFRQALENKLANECINHEEL